MKKAFINRALFGLVFYCSIVSIFANEDPVLRSFTQTKLLIEAIKLDKENYLKDLRNKYTNPVIKPYFYPGYPIRRVVEQEEPVE